MSDKSRIHQLWVLGTEYADKSPALSRFYLEKMKSFAERGRIKLPDALKESFCQFCGSMFLIDNCSVRLKRKRKRTRRRKGKRLSSEESSESFQEPVKRATQAKTNQQLRKDRNHVVKCCKICGKRSFTQGLERVRSGLMEEKETSMLKTPKGPAYLTSTPLGGNSSIEQSAQSSRSERKRQRCRMSTARKLQSILQAENRRKSTPATPNIHDFLSSL